MVDISPFAIGMVVVTGLSLVLLSTFVSRKKTASKPLPYTYTAWRNDILNPEKSIEGILERCNGVCPSAPEQMISVEPRWRWDMMNFVSSGTASKQFMEHLKSCQRCRGTARTLLT